VIGVVVPTRNGGARFVRCLDGLARQRPAADAVVVIDSGSSDGTAEAARRAGARVLAIAPEEFDHGETRNRAAAELPRADVLVFLVQDAVPVGDGCLAALAAAATQAGVAAATARQVPPPEAGPLTASTVEASPMGAAAPRRVGPFRREELAALAPEGWRGLLLLDDVACAVRGALFRAAGGFPRTTHGEDALLAYDLLHAGWSLAHEPAAVVEHGHAYDARSVADRYRIDAAFFRERFGLRVRGGPLATLKGFVAERRRDGRWAAAHGVDDRLAFLRSSRRLRWAQVRAQREGSRGPLGRLPEPRPLPGPLELRA
jgi:rhamnosyltransferase